MAFNLGSITDFAGDVIENASSFPEWLRGQADSAEDQLIDQAQDIQRQMDQTGGQVEQNLKDSKAASTGADFGRWIAKPKNMILSGLLLFAIIWGARNFKVDS